MIKSKWTILSIVMFSILSLSACSDSSGGNITIKGAGSIANAKLLSAVDPTEFNLKIYKVAVSLSEDCTNLTTIYTNDSPVYSNFLGNPTIGQGTLPDGTYNCIAFEVSDNMTFIPAQSEGVNCVAGETYTIDICRPDSGVTSTLIDGSSTTCTGNSTPPRELGDDRVTIYMSTSGSDEGEAFVASSPISLQDAFEVSGSAVATFVADGTGAVEDTGFECDMGAPAFSFR